MKKLLFILITIVTIASGIHAQNTNNQSLDHPNNLHDSCSINQAFEIESLAPMFFTGGFHLAVCYRFNEFRIRFSVINGGKYNAETAGINNSADNFKRYYKTSPGVFFGYNIWKGLELYTYLEFHTFEIEQKSSGIKKDMKSTDYGAGISYQYFFGKYFYLQPGLHLYLRKDNSINFGNATYNIPNADISPVIRVGIRLWEF
jgi:hypothetical protein